MADIELNLDESEFSNLARLLMGAGYADGKFHDLESDEIQRVLSELIHDIGLAKRVASELNEFDPDGFEVAEAVEGLGELDDADRKAVMTMIARVNDADFTHDFAESDYVKEVAEELDVPPEDYREHVVEIVEI